LAMSSVLSGSNSVDDGVEIHSASPIVSCNIYWPENEYMNGQAAFTLYTFTLAFAIPLILILVFYILVIRKLKVNWHQIYLFSIYLVSLLNYSKWLLYIFFLLTNLKKFITDGGSDQQIKGKATLPS
jgi:hypothetical protein